MPVGSPQTEVDEYIMAEVACPSSPIWPVDESTILPVLTVPPIDVILSSSGWQETVIENSKDRQIWWEEVSVKFCWICVFWIVSLWNLKFCKEFISDFGINNLWCRQTFNQRHFRKDFYMFCWNTSWPTEWWAHHMKRDKSRMKIFPNSCLFVFDLMSEPLCVAFVKLLILDIIQFKSISRSVGSVGSQIRSEPSIGILLINKSNSKRKLRDSDRLHLYLY